MTEHWATVVAGLISVIGAVIVACISRQKVKDRDIEIKRVQNEMSFQKKSIGLTDYIRGWKEIEHDIKEVASITPIDRFLIFGAWNGELSPSWTTAHWQFRLGEQEYISYVHTELDDDYIIRMRQMISKGHVIMATKDLPESLIKDIYETEKVIHSVWFHISSEKLPNSKSVSITYCSFASCSKELTNEDVTRCRLVVGRLKELAFNSK